jgi:hypothetical protein
MSYLQWVQAVLKALSEAETVRTRLVGLAIPALREPLGMDLADVDAIEDAVYDLEVLGLVRRRPNSFVNLTVTGRRAAEQSIDAVCGETIRETCRLLSGDERRFVEAAVKLSETEQARFTRLQYVDVVSVLQEIGVELARGAEEAFLLSLVEKACIDYREFEGERDVSPLFTGVACASAKTA